MRTQLVLIDSSTDWRLDERTKELGRQGVATARRALAAAAEQAAQRAGRDAMAQAERTPAA